MAIFNPFTLSGKCILITGASAGIGRAIAITCSKMGATLQITGRNAQRVNETFQLLEGNGHGYTIADLSSESDIDSLVSDMPLLDGIVHCAGIGFRKPCKMLTASDVDDVMNVNFKSAVLLQSSLLGHKKVKKNASIVFLASRAAVSPSIGNALYSASKGAIISYANCLALELAPRLIRVNCICPAMVWTDLILKGGLTKEDLEQEQLKYPLRRYGKPEDVANLAIYLLSDASSWMTGSNIDLTGGGE
ncbi:SDR family NAD(P)-dependent oxidoreductase [Mediterranea massiliensis]|uniref:SDR family NAD(P)-dependent oxidoreductase n=1 Tax=Mediterranea massiliensis TaxID=1841865 RepID=UPI0025A3ADCC|nr:SDR family oxidoreductase [Mediterranea massiliensis]MDM8338443.1 SDR family oxidoreductase [Mediterranea massiliensis]